MPPGPSRRGRLRPWGPHCHWQWLAVAGPQAEAPCLPAWVSEIGIPTDCQCPWHDRGHW